ncbi:phage major capsid protein [Lachnospiraceae bacterium MD335]|nr:phage major capsid protein [Lachnospiraceae bacterium MD335]
MNEELKKLLDSIKAKKQEVKDLCKAGKIEDAANAKEELKNLQAQFDLLYDLEQEALDDVRQQAEKGTAKKIVDQTKKVANAFANAVKAMVGAGELTESDKEILNSMNEGSDKDGGLTVPQDIKTKIRELRRSEDALELLVNVERVSTLSGSRVIEPHADQTPFDNVDEAAEFPEASTPEFALIKYKVKKKGGILKITQELLSDTAENIIGYLKKWIAKKAKATRNFLIIAKVREITKDAEVPVMGLDDLKRIFNILLDPAIALSASVVTNQDGYNWLDTLKDKDGKYIIQPDPTKPMSMMLFGKYPIKKVSNKTLPSTKAEGGYKVPIICGDLKEAITIFDRETLTIDISNVAGKLWETDQTGIKVRERLDIQSVDEEAVIMAEHLIETSDGGTVTASIKPEEKKIYAQTEIEAMTKADILALGTQLGYTMTMAETNTKEQIVADFMAQQAQAQEE